MRPNQFSRTGTVLTSEKAKGSHELADYLMEKIKILDPGMIVDFDCIHNNGGGYGVHEFCGALGGVSVRYMNVGLHERILREAIDSRPGEMIDYGEMIRNSPVLDKYTLRGTAAKYDEVVFLSGSNIMHENIDFELVKKAVDGGAVIKPHPVTNAKDMTWLRGQFGDDKVIATKVSGGELLRGARRVHVAKNSELYLLAIAFKKSIRDIGLVSFMPEVYRPAIHNIRDHPRYIPIVAMNRLFSSSQGGIYFTKEGIDNGLPLYIERVKELRA